MKMKPLCIPIGELWGMSETCGVATANPPDRVKLGTVGPPVPGIDIRIADAIVQAIRAYTNEGDSVLIQQPVSVRTPITTRLTRRQCDESNPDRHPERRGPCRGQGLVGTVNFQLSLIL